MSVTMEIRAFTYIRAFLRVILKNRPPKDLLTLLSLMSILLIAQTGGIPIRAQDGSNGFPNQIVLTHGVSQLGLFSNNSMSHNWRFENVPTDQVIYLSITPDFPYSKSEFNVDLYIPDGVSFNHVLSETLGSSAYLGSFTTPISGDWILQVNDTRTLRDTNVTYEILVSIPTLGYNEDTAVKVNQTIGRNFTIAHETHYWKVDLEKNQNGTLFLKEVDLNVLFQARLKIYPENSPQNPILPITEIRGSYNFSWNPGTQGIYYIVLEHNQEISLIGQYNISFAAEQYGYSFQTAGELLDNHTTTLKITQGYIPRKKYFFWFQVNHSRAEIFIRVFEDNRTTSTVLDFAIIEIFDEGGQNRIFDAYEAEQDRDGEINITNTLVLDIGKYYLVVSPESNAVGVFHIHLKIRPPRPFVWDVTGILLIISALIVLPGYLIYQDTKGRWFRVNQWSVPASQKGTYRLLKDSFRGIFSLEEVPEDSILVRVASIPLSTYALINCVESTGEETLVFSKRLRRKPEWVIYIFIGVAFYTGINLLSYLLLSQHFLPFDIVGITNLLLVLVIPLIVLGIPVLFVNVSPIITYKQLCNRLSYVIQNYQRVTDSGIEPVQQLDLERMIKNINYVRVLWNQAKRAFKERNYELFVIKADTAVKNLLFVRYQQIISKSLLSKPDFTMQVEELRKFGYDLPSNKKIVHYRNIRNRIVHSSMTLGEKESIDCYAYYNTFITRLGLRPT